MPQIIKMIQEEQTTHEPTDAQKKRKGLNRLKHATGYSLAGLRAAYATPAFKTEVLLSLALIPLAFYLGTTWLQRALLIACWLLVMIVELLNTGIEAAIDRIGTEWHALSKMAKDVGSAAVLLSLILAGCVWIAVALDRYCA